MWGYPLGVTTYSAAVPPEIDLHSLVFCNQCSCTYLDRCPEHPTVKVTLSHGEKGFQISR
jgi:hypothetical protein